MLRNTRLPLLLIAMLLLLGSCHRTPEHAKYIPKNALMVAEVNTKELSKKIAWSMITGSNLWERLKGKKSKKDTAKQSEFIQNMTDAGVDELNSFYAYLKNNGSNSQACFVALIPLKDARKWESFVKKSFTTAVVKETKKRKEAQLSEDIYAGWTNNLLIVVSIQQTKGFDDFGQEILAQPDQELVMASHLASAFEVTEENSLLSDKRFASFQHEKHDFGFWINIEAVMNNYGSKNLGMITGGLSLANTMWRNSAFSAATNFEKGRVVTEMLMYSSDEMKEINDKYSNENIDQNMLGHISNEGLDYVMACHMSTQGTLKTIEKMGMLGLANGYLKDQNLSVAEILNAISGDMVISMNNYTQTKETLFFDSSDASSAFSNYKTDLDLVFALKINNQASFQKILNLALQMNLLEKMDEHSFKIKSAGSAADSSVILLNDTYVVFANKSRLAKKYLAKDQKAHIPLLVNEHISKHPFGMFFDYNNWAKNMSTMLASNEADSIVYAASLKTFDNFVFNGGTSTNNTFKYKMSINLVNKKESSIIQLLDFGKAMQEAQDIRDKEAEEMAEQFLEAAQNNPI